MSEQGTVERLLSSPVQMGGQPSVRPAGDKRTELSEARGVEADRRAPGHRLCLFSALLILASVFLPCSQRK